MCALRTISGFRTISDDAAYVIAGMVPVDILADEMSRVTKPAGARSSDEKSHERIGETSLNSDKGRWT